MSSISASSSGTSSILQYLQSLKAGKSGSKSKSAASAFGGNGGDSLASALSGSGKTSGGGASLFSQIQSTVSSALQSAQSSSSKTDPNTVIQNAIEQFLQTQKSGAAAATGPRTASNSDDSTSATADSSSASKSAFAQLLQSAGVDPQQFHKDFLSAVQSAQQGGSTQSSNPFSAFPTGSAVDAIA